MNLQVSAVPIANTIFGPPFSAPSDLGDWSSTFNLKIALSITPEVGNLHSKF